MCNKSITFGRATCLFKLLTSNLWDKLRTNLCRLFALLFSVFNRSILFFILLSAKDSFV